MTPEASFLLLDKKLGGSRDHEPGTAIDLVKKLDFMPLAISQAAAFICKKAPFVTLAEYLKTLSKGEHKAKTLLLKLPKTVGGTRML